jgi:Flp pilus assembly pilin Flp
MIRSLLTNAFAVAGNNIVRRAPTAATAAPGSKSTLIADQRGALTFIEWIIIFAVVVVVIAIAAGELADTVDEKFGEVGDTIQGLETNIQ